MVTSAIQKHNELYSNFAIQFDDDFYSRLIYTDEEISALISGEKKDVIKSFASEYSIVIGDKIYSPVWVYSHSIDDYTAAGITNEMIDQKLALYSEFNLTNEAATAFESKLSDF